MDQVSSFQQNHPLSRKKIWKKLCEKLPFILIVAIFIAGSFASTGYLSIAYATEPDTFSLKYFIFINTIACIGMFIVLWLLYMWYFRAYINHYYYNVDESFVTIKKGVFTPREIHIQFQKIQDVYVDQDLLDRLFGLYDVHLASATVSSGLEAHIDGVEAPVAEAIKNELLNKIKGSGLTPHTPPPPIPSAPLRTAEPAATTESSVSSTTYPISNRWYINSILGSFLSALLIPIILGGVFYSIASDNLDYIHKYIISDSTATIILITLAIILFIFGVIQLIIWRRTFFFALTPEFILLRQGVIAREERHVPYSTIQNVMLQQGLWEKILGICQVTIQNAAANGTAEAIIIPGQTILKGNQLVSEINKELSSVKQTSGAGV